MKLRVGRYLTQTQQAKLTTSSRFENDANGLPVLRTDRIDCTIILDGSGQADLDAQVQTLKLQLHAPFQDVVFLTDAGQITEVHLFNASSVSGVKLVDGPKCPQDGTRTAEYATVREVSFACEATYACAFSGSTRAFGPPFGGATNLGPTSGVNGQAIMPGQGSGWTMVPLPGFFPLPANLPQTALRTVIEFEEQLQRSGSGPLYVTLPALSGLPQRQLIYEQMPARATLSGRAVGLFAWPTPPLPLWPLSLRVSPQITFRDPKRKGLTWQNWEVQWAYEFEDVDKSLLIGNPRVWMG